MKIRHSLLMLLAFLSFALFSCSKVELPEPVGPIPSENQLVWHELEYYAFIHFNMNTFTNMEWGSGAEKPSMFNPTKLDTRQWAKVAKEAGMKAIIITAKHHDGFCLWPTMTTEHSIKNSPYKNGKGDIIKELAEACKEFGLNFGVYLSPWDRNHAEYGRPGYIEDFQAQLRELLSNYGDVFEVWFDGANGGSGYYGGANETRKIDNKTYYQWEKAIAIIRELQPNAVIFGDGGPGVRWVGNEEGWADETNWSIIRKNEVYPGWPKYKQLRSGHEDGTHWVPAEADVSIRPGWYYHQSEDHQVKTLPHLLDIYYRSVGRNASLLLNLPVDDRGLVHETDSKQLMALKTQLAKDFKLNLAIGQKITASDIRGRSSNYAAENINDANNESYWAASDSILKASIIVEFDAPSEVNRILLQEYVRLGQRVKEFTVDAEIDGKWIEIDRQTTIGYKRILRFNTVKASKIRVNIIDAKGSPTLSNIELYRAPNLLTEPFIKRNKKGMVSITVPDKNVEVYYTLDGTIPVTSSSKYRIPFLIDNPTMIKAIAYNPDDKQKTAVVVKYVDINKKDWKVIKVSSGEREKTDYMIDDDPLTFWATDQDVKSPQEIVIDLGKQYNLKGFTYWPMQERWSFGIITHYEFLVSRDNKNWEAAAKGEFGNIVNNPIEQTIKFNKTKGRYIKLIGFKVIGDDYRASFGDIGIITAK